MEQKSDKKYWFIKKGTKGTGFGALLGYPNTWQGVVFWGVVLFVLLTIPSWIESNVKQKGLGILAALCIVWLVWFPVTAIKTKYLGEEEAKKDESNS